MNILLNLYLSLLQQENKKRLNQLLAKCTMEISTVQGFMFSSHKKSQFIYGGHVTDQDFTMKE